MWSKLSRFEWEIGRGDTDWVKSNLSQEMPLHVSDSNFWQLHFDFLFQEDVSATKGCTTNRDKMWSMHFVNRQFDGQIGNAWRIFPQYSWEKSKKILSHHYNTLERQICDTSHAISKLEFFPKNYGVTFWLLHIYFHGQKWTGMNYYNLSNHHICTSVVPWEL